MAIQAEPVSGSAGGNIAHPRRRIIAATAIVIILAWLSILGWAVSERERLIQGAESRLGQLAATTEEQMQRLFKTTELSLLTTNEWLTTHDVPHPNSDPAFIQIVDNLRRLSNGVMDIRTVGEDGSLHLVPELPGASAGNIRARESIVAQTHPMTRGFYIGAPVTSPADGRAVIPVTVPAGRNTGGIAIVAGVLDLDQLVAMLESQRVRPRGSLAIIRADGMSMLRAPATPAALGQSIAGTVDFIEHLSRRPHDTYRIDGMYDGINRVVSYTTLERYGLIVAATIPTADILSSWRREVTLLSAAAAIASVLFALFAQRLVATMKNAAEAHAHLARQSEQLSRELAERRSAQERLAASEAKIQALFSQAPLAIWVLDYDGTVVECNDTFLNLAGSTREQAIGFHMVTPEGDQTLVPYLRRGLAGETISLETEYTSGCGGRRSHFHFIFKPLSFDGTFSFLLCFAEDIGERKQMEQAVIDGKNRYDELVRAISVGIYVYSACPDGTRNFDYVSPRFCEILGVTEAEVMANPRAAFDAVHSEDLPGLLDASRQAVESLSEVRWEGRIIVAGETRWLRIESHPSPGADGCHHWNGVITDITDQKSLELALRRSNAELEEFAYVASHDLREPLRMVSSYMGLLERRYAAALDGDGLEFLNFAKDGATRMDRLVQDLLDFSRIGRKSEPPALVPLGEVVDQSLRALRLAIEESGAQVRVAPDLPSLVCTQSEIARLFQNLVANAVKYRAPDRPPQIDILCARHAEGWRFTVADNGIGIEKTYWDRIFGIFQRLHTRDKYEGTGIGLAVCKKIVERHGGRIWVESTPGEGSRFQFILPAFGSAAP